MPRSNTYSNTCGVSISHNVNHREPIEAIP
ncbi:hypothetical protein [Escherichia phage UPEC06]|nr:hypothetical protein [Escherichia phage UPEC06]